MNTQDLEQILSQLDNIKFFEANGLRPKKKTGKSWPCECPFCGDKKHLNFDPKTGLWQCFKCNESGNAVSFYAKRHNCTNGDAVKAIKEFMGIVDEPQPSRKNNKAKSKTNSKQKKEDPKNVGPAKPQIYDRLIQLAQLTPEHREELQKKRGFNDKIIDSLRFRSGGDYMIGVVQQIQDEYEESDLVSAGILVDVNGSTIINDQLKDGRILIPYLDAAGNCYHLRPHKLGFKDIPPEAYCRLLLRNKPEHVVITEGEFKAAALLQWGIPALAIPGVSTFGKLYFERFLQFLKEHNIKKTTIIFDSEEKGNPEYPNYKEKAEDRYDTEYWSYFMGYQLSRHGVSTKIGWLPAEWRENGKIDFDGALAQGRSKEDIIQVISKAKTPKEYKNSLDEEAHKIVERKLARYFAKEKIKRDFNRYIALRFTKDKSWEETISNFVINIKSSFYTPSGVVRNVELVNQYGEASETFVLEPGSMAGVNEFKKFLLSKGNYLFYGKGDDLTNIWEYEFLRDTGELIWMPEKIGKISGDIWLFGNMGIKDGKCYPPDNDGIIWIDKRGYKPQSLRVGPGGEPLEDSIPALSIRHIDIKEIAYKLKQSIGGYEAYMGIGWVVAAIFADEIFRVYKCSPILFPHGKRESGKSTFMRWLMNFFGIETEGISVGRTTTQNFVARILSYRSCIGVWFDEYRNELGVVEKDGLFRSAYNRQVSGKGTATAFQAKGFSVNAVMAISGEELPKDNGLFTRCIPLQISSYKRDRTWYDWLNKNSVQFSSFAYHLLLHYEEYKKKVLQSIAELKRALIKLDVTDRTAENWAICAAAFEATVMEDDGFIRWVEKSCQEIKRTGEEEHMLNQFWEDVNYLVSNNDVGFKHIRVSGDKLYVWLAGLYETWALHYKKKTGREPFDRQSIIKYLQDEPYYITAEPRKMGSVSRKVHILGIESATDIIKEISCALDIQTEITENSSKLPGY